MPEPDSRPPFGYALGTSASSLNSGVFEEVVLPRGRSILDRFSLMHELRQSQGVLWLYGELNVRVFHQFHQEVAVDVGAAYPQIDIGGLLGMFRGKLGRLTQGLEEGGVGLRIGRPE